MCRMYISQKKSFRMEWNETKWDCSMEVWKRQRNAWHSQWLNGGGRTKWDWAEKRKSISSLTWTRPVIIVPTKNTKKEQKKWNIKHTSKWKTLIPEQRLSAEQEWDAKWMSGFIFLSLRLKYVAAHVKCFSTINVDNINGTRLRFISFVQSDTQHTNIHLTVYMDYTQCVCVGGKEMAEKL